MASPTPMIRINAGEAFTRAPLVTLDSFCCYCVQVEALLALKEVFFAQRPGVDVPR